MDFAHLYRRFDAIGARLRIVYGLPRRSGRSPFVLDIHEDRRRGDHYLVYLSHTRTDHLDLTVPALDPRRRHLILQARDRDGVRQFLCGHDERHWFVAGLPRNVTGIDDAFTALMPEAMNGAELRAGLRAKHRDRRANGAWKRQGEWFFVPAPEFDGDAGLVYHRDEPLMRGSGKPHVAEMLHRRGGEEVWANASGTEIYAPAEYQQLRRRNWQQARAAGKTERRRLIRRLDHLRLVRRDPEVYVRGRITHPDHATVVLETWHRVMPNAEPTDDRMRFGGPVAFLD